MELYLGRIPENLRPQDENLFKMLLATNKKVVTAKKTNEGQTDIYPETEVWSIY